MEIKIDFKHFSCYYVLQLKKEQRSVFVRVKTTPNSPRKSVQIVESYRVDRKIKQKILRHVGIAMDEQEELKLKDLAQDIIAKILKERENDIQLGLFDTSESDYKKFVKRKVGRPKRKSIEDVIPPEQVTLDKIKEKTRVIDGVHEVGGKMYDEIGYNDIFKSKKDNNLLKDLVLSRLAFPCSKRKTCKLLTEQFAHPHNLDAIYRLMDKLHNNIPKIKTITFNRTKNLFPDLIDVVLFDVTTLYFESTTTDDLRNFGYSKDHRFNTTQVVLALATNQDGLPIGYELFPGNTAEVKTLIAAINSWKKAFDINSVCFIGDRAMFSKDNIKLINEHGYEYIIAAKLRSMPANLKQEILNETNYGVTVNGGVLAWVGEFEYQEQRLITNYKSKRALRDQKNRDGILDKINKRLGKSGKTEKIINNVGVKKYTKPSKDSITEIDNDKVSSESEWDGMHGVITNITTEKAEHIIARYSRLWVIEESFRVNKYNLKMRPIYHWKTERIMAHIAICYMSFSLLRNLEYKINLQQKVSIEDILYELLNVQSSIHYHTETQDLYRLPGSFSQTARKIYKAMDLDRSLDASIYLP